MRAENISVAELMDLMMTGAECHMIMTRYREPFNFSGIEFYSQEEARKVYTFIVEKYGELNLNEVNLFEIAKEAQKATTSIQ